MYTQYARLIRPFGVFEAAVSDYRGLAFILRKFKDDISIVHDGESDLLKVEAENRDATYGILERLKIVYSAFAERARLKERLNIEPLF